MIWLTFDMASRFWNVTAPGTILVFSVDGVMSGFLPERPDSKLIVTETCVWLIIRS